MQKHVPLDKIIQNIASNGEAHQQTIQEWIGDSKENEKIYQDLLNIWQVTGSFPGRYAPDRTSAWQNVKQQIKSRKKAYPFYRRMAQVAAAIIVIFLSIEVGSKLDDWQQPDYTEIVSPAGQKSRVILPDSSVVQLNGDSRLRYSQNFNKHDRKVELTGEGYFEVRKNKSMQFVVQTSALDVKVYGTKFNVKAYDDDRDVEVGLKNGWVGLERQGKEVAELHPGQGATFNKKERTLRVKKVDTNLISVWTDNEMVFDEAPMSEIVKYMERWYGVDIEISPQLLDGQLYTFKVKTESLKEALQLVNLLKPIRFKIDGQKVRITEP